MEISDTSDEHEFYSPLPEGYVKGKTKYVFVFGTVMSGLGKGIFSSSLGKILKDQGLRVAPIKLEGYLNKDSGTLNPFRHGEVFVLDDGMECDMDLGTYERILDTNLSKANFTTNGQILSAVFEKERKGVYLGRDVQIIPHVTAEIKLKLRELSVKQNADVVLVEIGGTVGDLENMNFIEAVRQLAYEEGPGQFCHVALTFILEPKILREQKSKAAQLGIKSLMDKGIQPHIIACRAASIVTEKIKEKISVYTNVPLNRVISMHDQESIYFVPEVLRESGIVQEVIKILDLGDSVDKDLEKENQKKWAEYLKGLEDPTREITVGIAGKYTGVRDSYASIIKAIEHSSTKLGIKTKIVWIDTSQINDDNVEEHLKEVRGIIVPGGFGKRGFEGKISCIRYAREQKLPYLGLCYGFQTAVIEFARNVCRLEEANSTEIDPDTKEPVIDILPEQKKIEGLGGNMRLGGRDVIIKKDSKAHAMYAAEKIRERFRHRYEVDPKYIELLEQHGLVFSGKAPDYPIMQILELPSHPFFVGSQFHPEFLSRPLRPHPLFTHFLKAASDL